MEYDDDGKFWIETTESDGEGGTFDESELEKVIAAFYQENF